MKQKGGTYLDVNLCEKLDNENTNQKLMRWNNVMKLETERLDLLPLQACNLALSVENYGEMETGLGLNVTNTILDEEMQHAMKVRLRKVLEDRENYLWLTNWAIVLKEENRIIGFISTLDCCSMLCYDIAVSRNSI